MITKNEKGNKKGNENEEVLFHFCGCYSLEKRYFLPNFTQNATFYQPLRLLNVPLDLCYM